MCKCDWKNCARQCNCRCHVAIEAYSDHSYKVGIYTGLLDTSGLLMKEATAAFTSGLDSEAPLLRNLSMKIKEDALKRHPGPIVKFEVIHEAK